MARDKAWSQATEEGWRDSVSKLFFIVTAVENSNLHKRLKMMTTTTMMMIPLPVSIV
jgi:hypothetical protein